MRPNLVNVETALESTPNYDQIIDVRSPAEFELDHIPGAINLPVLSNDERHRVGILYKCDPFQGRLLGASLVTRNIATHLSGPLAQHPKSWRPLVYCWRGGLRSGSMATVMGQIGWQVTLLDGGYKAFRRHTHQALEQLAQHQRYHIICGASGSGKTELLHQLRQQGAQVLDLEHLAHHRGSILGREPHGAQPSQKAFETAIWQQLRQFSTHRPIFVEAESRKIGKLFVPEALMTALRHSACTEIQAPLAIRAARLCRDYQHFTNEPSSLTAPLASLVVRHGHHTVARWLELAQAQQWLTLAHELLDQHYDPLYQRSTAQCFTQYHQACRRNLLQGDPSEFATLAAAIIHNHG